MLELFSSREIAIVIWLFLFIILTARNTNVRHAFFGIIRTAFNKKVIIPLVITLIYSVIWIKFTSSLHSWDWKYLKDIILWILLIGVPICFNAVAEKSDSYFRDTIKSNFMFIVFLEFIIGTFTFKLIVELILVPIATILVLLNMVAASDKAYKSAERFLSFLQVTFGLFVLYYSINNAVNQYIELNSFDLFIAFSIPIVMTFLFIPLAYMFALYAEYEVLFLLLNFRLNKNKKIRKEVKWRIISTCKLSWKKVNTFKKNHLNDIYSKMTKEEFEVVMEKFYQLCKS